MQRRSCAFGPQTNEGAEREPGNGDAGPGGSEPVLSEAKTGKGKDDAAERDELRALLQLRRTGEPDPVGGGCTAQL